MPQEKPDRHIQSGYADSARVSQKPNQSKPHQLDDEFEREKAEKEHTSMGSEGPEPELGRRPLNFRDQPRSDMYEI